MPKVKLTALAVARLTPPPKGQIDYFDTSMPSFGLRLSPKGTRTYFLMTRIHGRLSRLTLGQAKTSEDCPGLTLAEARAKAGEWADLAASGQDPRQLRQEEKAIAVAVASNTFETVAKRFMQQHAEPNLAASTCREYKRVLLGADTSAWKHRPVASITRADVRAVLDSMVERGSAGAANNTLAYLSKFFNWCAEKDLLEIPPTDRLKKPGPKNIGDRTLSASEIREVWDAFEHEGGTFGDLFKLLLLTGQRRGEVAGMRAREITYEGEEPIRWEIPKERTKNGRPHIVPLSPQAAAIIKDRKTIGDEGFLFSYTGKTPVSGFGKIKARVDVHITNKRKEADLPPLPAWDLHDLRRTMVTMMNEALRIPPHVVEACVNHVSGMAKAGVAGVYNKALYLEERKSAFAAWGTYWTHLWQGRATSPPPYHVTKKA